VLRMVVFTGIGSLEEKRRKEKKNGEMREE
jgi:hypothetical protein